MAERQNSLEALLQEADETIAGIIRKKFRVSLSELDGREENQNALELVQQIRLLVWAKLSAPEGEAVRDVRGYAAVLTYNQCSQQIRQENPEWSSLKNRLRYFFNESAGYTVWPNEPAGMLCGYVSWQNRKRPPLEPGKLEKLAADTWSILPKSLLGKSLQQLKRNDWEQMMDAVFNHLESPVELNELVNLIGEAFGVVDIKEGSLTPPEDSETSAPPIEIVWTGQSPEDEAIQRQYLSKLWAEICQLRANQRLAYLLNFRDADGDLQVFTLHGVANLIAIGNALQLSDQQFECAWEELPLDETTRRECRSCASYDEKFAALFSYIPLEDMLIARLLGGDRQQVINLRRLARDRLAKRMEAFK